MEGIRLPRMAIKEGTIRTHTTASRITNGRTIYHQVEAFTLASFIPYGATFMAVRKIT
jgi:hypothetical protein